ncbi:hypothetical protein [Streptomyces sp. NPDC051636]|uniref:hypothetical protein n=1 Tax=Streptomyces sp. NPDC051636 TaxID=3365663 RepID=UPI0037AF9FCF
MPLTLLILLAAYSCRPAVTIRPSGPWDGNAYTGITVACVMTWAAPARRRHCG